MKDIGIGEVVVFSTGEGFKSNVGLILKRKENGNYVVLSQYNCIYKDCKSEWISTLDAIEDVRNEIKEKMNEKISARQKQIRKVTDEEKETEKIAKYRELQTEIKAVAKKLSESTDDDDFENKLKAICDMKKSIFSIELECVSEIRRKNGKLKFEIKELARRRDAILDRISDENIAKTFDF